MLDTSTVAWGIGASSLALAAVYVLLLAGVELVAQLLYLFSWLPTLVLLDLLVVRFGGQPMLVRRPAATLSTIWWSAVIWLVFEAFNVRLRAWYYVGVPG